MRFRQINRMRMHLPLRVTLRKGLEETNGTRRQVDPRGTPEARPEVEYTVTENICPDGCYFFLTQEPPVGSRLEMEITIPGEVHDVPFARIYCRGEVVRVDCVGKAEAGAERFGVEVTIERLQDVSVESIPRPAENAAGMAIA